MPLEDIAIIPVCRETEGQAHQLLWFPLGVT